MSPSSRSRRYVISLPAFRIVDYHDANSYPQVANTFLTGKATLVSVGDIHQLPFAEDLGLTV